MRIALVYDALYPWVSGGAERRFHELGRRLAADHEVTHVSWQWWEGASTMRLDGIDYLGVGRPPVLYGRDGKRTVREAASFAARVIPALLKNRWDVVDCSATPYLPLYGAWVATRLTRVPLVATWHEYWGAHWAAYLPDRRLVASVAHALEAAARPLGDVVVAVSPFTLRRMGRTASPSARIVGNGVEIDRAGPTEPRTLDVAYVGRLIDEKRCDLLIDAIGLLRDAGREVQCVIAGDGPARSALIERCVASDLGDLVSLPGQIDDLERQRLLARARTFVMPSLREGFGIGVIEAQAAGAVPVVVRGPHTAAASLIVDGVDGIVVDPTPASIAEALVVLLQDPIRLADVRRGAVAGARRHDWDVIAAEMEQAYRFAVRPSHPPRVAA